MSNKNTGRQSDGSNMGRNKLLTGILAFEQRVKSQNAEGGIAIENDIEVMDRYMIPPPEKPADSGTPRNPDGIVDIVTFCEHPHFLKLRLTPWQKVILKSFYCGEEGNTKLKIDDTESEVGCTGCVWEYIKNNEDKHYYSVKHKTKRVTPLMLAENSPCLSCSRYDPEKMAQRYETLKAEAITDGEAEEFELLSERPTRDLFLNEMNLLYDPQIKEAVREQVLGKVKRQRKFQELLLVLGRRSGKALDITTPMLTTKGWKTMGDLQVGEQVYGPDGKPTNIVAITHQMHNRPCYKITFSNGETLIADEQHEWVTETKLDRKYMARGQHIVPKTRTTKEIYETLTYNRKDGKRENNHAIRVASAIQNDDKDLPIDPYMLGVFLGDGTAPCGHLTSGDPEIVDQIRERTTFKPYKQEFSKYGYCMGKDEHGRSFKELLQDCNLIDNKHIPDEYFNASEKQRWELLRGIMDTDGSAFANGRVELSLSNATLAEDTYKLICSLGIKSSIRESNATLNGKVVGGRYRMCFTPAADCILFHLSRKQERFVGAKGQGATRIFITNVEKIESVPVKCIQVDNETNMYLAGRALIPTHNSFLVSVIALYEVYRLISMGHPQARFPLMEFDTITICNVAVSERQAKEAIFNKVSQLVLASPYFMGTHNCPKRVGHKNQLEIFFLTDHDLEENKRRAENAQEQLLGTIQLMSGHSNSNSLVGRTMAVIIIDEMAAMAGKESGNDDDLYSQLKPSIATFGRAGKIICISNPLGPSGKFWNLYNASFLDDTTLMFQLPTWLSNPNIEKAYLRAEELKDPANYSMHYGAEFGVGINEPFLPIDFVNYAFEKGINRKRVEAPEPGVDYYAHLDPAESSDYYTLAVVHAEPSEILGPDGEALMQVVVDHVHYFEPVSVGQPVDSTVVDEHIIRLHRVFNFKQVSYDHWHSAESILKLKRYRVNAKKAQFNREFQHDIYNQLYEMFVQGRIIFYGLNTYVWDEKKKKSVNIKEVDLSREQFTFLQKKWRNGRYKIEAAHGHHDDIPDCVAAASFFAMNTSVYSKTARPRTVRTSYFGTNR
jgi:hypothetical protein